MSDTDAAEIRYSLLDWGTEDSISFVEFTKQWPLHAAMDVLAGLVTERLIVVGRDGDLTELSDESELAKNGHSDPTDAIATIKDPKSWEPAEDWADGGNVAYILTRAGWDEYERLARERFRA